MVVGYILYGGLVYALWCSGICFMVVDICFMIVWYMLYDVLIYA